MTQTATILAITGAQQSAIAARFLAAGWTVRGTSRKPNSSEHGWVVAADLDSGEGLAEAMAGSDAVVLTLPQDHRDGAMPRIARQVAEAAASAGVGRLVLNTAGTIDEAADRPLFQDMRAARRAVQEAGVPSVVLQPTVYMDNLLQPWSLPAIVDNGVLAYPAPEQVQISWLSHRSLADFVHAAATRADAVGRDLHIGGPEALTGAELAALLGTGLGRPVAYQRIPLEAFAKGLDDAFGAPAGQRIASLYARLDTHPDVMTADSTAATLLGVTPESFASFVERQDWQRT
jgi:uncharacterized protein YbjT (DUF2867 family)